MPSDHLRLKWVGPTVTVSKMHARNGSTRAIASCKDSSTQSSAAICAHIPGQLCFCLSGCAQSAVMRHLCQHFMGRAHLLCLKLMPLIEAFLYVIW